MSSTVDATALTGAQFAEQFRDTSGMDAEMIVFADQIQRSSERVEDTIREIKIGDRTRDVIGARLDDLREANAAIKAITNNGQDKIPTKKKDLEAFKKDFLAQFDENDQAHAEELFALTRNFDVRVNPQTGAVSTEEGGALFVPGSLGNVAEAEIQRLEGLISKMDGEREIALVRLNQETNNKSRALSLAVNLLKAKNDSAKMVISALRSTG